MAKRIDTQARIERVRLQQMFSHPASPDSGYESLYIISGSSHGGLFVKDSSGREIGPFITGTASSAGAPSNAEYITSAANGSLSSEVVIPGLAGSADRASVAGAGNSYEFDSSSDPFTWSSNPNTFDSDTTFPSHYYIKSTDNTTRVATIAWSPAGAFDARIKLAIGGDSTTANTIMFIIYNSGDNEGLGITLEFDGTNLITKAYTYDTGSFTQRGSTITQLGNEVYLRLVRDGSNNCSFYWSIEGKLWRFIATQSKTFTVAKLGIRVSAAGAITQYAAVDWIRTDVL